jgi:hypothetical protein
MLMRIKKCSLTDFKLLVYDKENSEKLFRDEQMFTS